MDWNFCFYTQTHNGRDNGGHKVEHFKGNLVTDSNSFLFLSFVWLQLLPICFFYKLLLLLFRDT